jgi:hypothetical protein
VTPSLRRMLEQPASDAILRLGFASWGSRALLSAVELGLFTTLAHGPLTAQALAAELGLQPRGTTDWLDALVSLGILERTGDLYANTAATGLFLDRANPSYLGGVLEMANARLYPFWGSLTEALRTGRPKNEAKAGEDFFADPLPGADVLIMGHILHDWSLEEKLLLIRKAYDALPEGGALIVYESIIDDDRRANTFGLLMSVNMLIETAAGFDYTVADCRSWMAATGFRDSYAEPLAGPDSMVVGIK